MRCGSELSWIFKVSLQSKSMRECYFGFPAFAGYNLYSGQNIAPKIREIRQALERDGLTGPDMGSRPQIYFTYSERKLLELDNDDSIPVNEMFELPDTDFDRLWCDGFDAEGSCRGCPYVSEAIGKKQPAIARDSSQQPSMPE